MIKNIHEIDVLFRSLCTHEALLQCDEDGIIYYNYTCKESLPQELEKQLDLTSQKINRTALCTCEANKTVN